MKFRASFTVLDKWSKGDWKGAVETYFKLRELNTPAIEEGKRFHAEWENEINNTQCLPKVFGGKKLDSPTTEQKITVQLLDWLELVFVADLVDNDTLIDFKTGKTPSRHYLNSMQIPVYALGLSLADVQVKKGFIYHYNQHEQTTDMSMFWLSVDTIKNALDWVETYASEMHSYLMENKLYEKFNK